MENRDGARFCSSCGSPVAVPCPSCGAELAAGARFCDQCGAPVGGTFPSPTPTTTGAAVRKTVTVLFADLGGSTLFVERLDPEVSRDAIAGYFAMLQGVVEANGGRVAKFTGDGVLATFGIPAVAEDDA